MSKAERFKPGQNVKVASCRKCKPFCAVLSEITKTGESGEELVSLNTPDCGCWRPQSQIEIIPDKLY